MFRFILALVLFAASAFAAVDLTTPIPELALNDGRKMRNVTIVGYNSQSVLARWDGGRGTIDYELFPAEFKSVLAERRPAPTKSAAAIPKKNKQFTAPPLAAGIEKQTISGQVFVTTQGAGAYKFTGSHVRAFPFEYYQSVLDKQRQSLPSRGFSRSSALSHSLDMSTAWSKALEDVPVVAVAETDADGRYKIELPKNGEFFLFCETSRLAGGDYEWNLWAVKVEGTEMHLNSGNMWRQPK